MSSLTHAKSHMTRCLAFVVTAGAALGLTACESWDEDDRDETVSYAELPLPVQRTVDAHLNGATIENIDMSRQDGRTVYDVEARGPQGEIEFVVASDGTFLGWDDEDEDDDDDHDDDADEGEADDPDDADADEEEEEEEGF